MRPPSTLPAQPPRPPAPLPPFDRWPVQAYDPAFGFAWYAEPATIVTQLLVEHGTLESARFIQDHIDLVLAHRGDEIARHSGVLIVHDWRVGTGYDADARREFMERLRARPRDYLRHAVTCITVTPMLRMGIEAGNLVLTLVTGRKGEVGHDPAPVLARHGVVMPRRGAPFPGRV